MGPTESVFLACAHFRSAGQTPADNELSLGLCLLETGWLAGWRHRQTLARVGANRGRGREWTLGLSDGVGVGVGVGVRVGEEARQKVASRLFIIKCDEFAFSASASLFPGRKWGSAWPVQRRRSSEKTGPSAFSIWIGINFVESKWKKVAFCNWTCRLGRVADGKLELGA